MALPSTENVQPDTPAAIAFLKAWAPGGPWCLVAIEPDKGAESVTYDADQATQAATWIDARQGRKNIYFLVNRPRHKIAGARHPEKEDISHVLALHVDVDPGKGAQLSDEQVRITTLLRQAKPSVLVNSGGGCQGFWLLKEPVQVDSIERTEAYNRGVEKRLGGDKCHNINRIMRLPGTINLPTRKKREAGRKPALAVVVEADWGLRYTLDDFEPMAEIIQGPIDPSGRKFDRSDLSEDCLRVIERGADADYNGDRSKAVYAVACMMVRAGRDDQEIVAVLLDKANGISAHVHDQGNPQRYAQRQAARARIAASSDFLKNPKTGHIAHSQFNIRLSLARMGASVSYDIFNRQMIVEGPDDLPRRYLDDSTMVAIYLETDERHKFRPPKEFYWMVVEREARKHSFHPVCDYLNELVWDGTPRIDTWLSDYAAVPETPYTRAVGALWLVAAVRRVRQPGCKFDEMLVFESQQGMDKSSALAALAVREEWFSDTLPLDADEKQVIEALSGAWIVEAAELKGLRKGDIEHLKSMLSRQRDKARLSYDRISSVVPRQCVIAGTTNSREYLRDTTGNRRFWPIADAAFNVAKIVRDRDQLWAEASAREATGCSIRLDPSLYDSAAGEQEQRLIDDPWVALIDDALGDYTTGRILCTDVWNIINLLPGQRQQEHNARLGESMRALGWERKQYRIDGKPKWHYAKGTLEERTVRIHCDRSGGELDIYPQRDGDRHPRAIEEVDLEE